MRISDWSSDVCSSYIGHNMLVCAADPAHHPLKGQGDWPGDFRCHVTDHPESCGIKDRNDRQQQSKQRPRDGYDIAREQSILRLAVVTGTPAEIGRAHV